MSYTPEAQGPQPAHNTPPQPRGELCQIGDVAIDVHTMGSAVDLLGRMVLDNRTNTVVTPNMNHLRIVNGPYPNGQLKRAYERADLVLPDGMPVKWLSHLTDTPLPERIAGSDVIPKFLQKANTEMIPGKHLNVIYVGGKTPEITDTAVSNSKERYWNSAIDFSGVTPGMNFGDITQDTDRVLEEIDEKSRDRGNLVLICAGSPKSEIWAERFRDQLPNGVVASVGAYIDFIAGSAQRSHPLMQKMGLEWLDRLARDPGRLAERYGGDAVHLARTAAELTAVKLRTQMGLD